MRATIIALFQTFRKIMMGSKQLLPSKEQSLFKTALVFHALVLEALRS